MDTSNYSLPEGTKTAIGAQGFLQKRSVSLMDKEKKTHINVKRNGDASFGD